MVTTGTNYNGEEVEFNGCRLCDCPLEQEMACGHWLVMHTDECPIESCELVRSCSGPWMGSATGLNTAKEFATWNNWKINSHPLS